MRVLVTNDEGVHAPGLAALTRSLVAAGHEVIVAAPLENVSGCGAGLGSANLAVRVERVELPNLLGTAGVIGVGGPPGMCVMVAHVGALGPRPDVVASGVNEGTNTG